MSESHSYHSDAASNFSEGLRLLRTGDYQAAVQAFSAAITLDPDHWTAYFRRAEAYRNLGMVKEARGDLARAEFLMAAVRQEGEESRTSSDCGGADTPGGAGYGCIVGAVVGIAAGLLCFYVAIIWMPLFGIVGAIFGSIFGGFLGRKVRWFSNGCAAGCVGGCLGGAFGVIIVVGVVALWAWSSGYI